MAESAKRIKVLFAPWVVRSKVELSFHPVWGHWESCSGQTGPHSYNWATDWGTEKLELQICRFFNMTQVCGNQSISENLPFHFITSLCSMQWFNDIILGIILQCYSKWFSISLIPSKANTGGVWVHQMILCIIYRTFWLLSQDPTWEGQTFESHWLGPQTWVLTPPIKSNPRVQWNTYACKVNPHA